jgi:methionine biosynthesis protein MetW
VLNMTLQAMRNPLLLIKEMVRVGRKGIVGFPNFSYWKVIAELVFTHHMPKTKSLPYDWYETPNIRMITVRDFKDLCRENNVRILKEVYLNENDRVVSSFLAGCRAAEGIFLLEKLS